jgi:hypothetical protein
MLTNIRESKGRKIKETEISTYQGRYYLDTPGNGLTLPYYSDPHIRIQTSSGVIGESGTVDWESELRGITRPLVRGDVFDYRAAKLPNVGRVHEYNQPISDESRTTLPAWTFRELEQNRWETPFLNPIDKAIIPFDTNMNIRRRECDQIDEPDGVCSIPGFVGVDRESVAFEPLLPSDKKWEEPVKGFTPYLFSG